MNYFGKFTAWLLIWMMLTPREVPRFARAEQELIISRSVGTQRSSDETTQFADPEHTHSEGSESESISANVAAASGSASADLPVFAPYGWEEAAYTAVRARYDALRRPAYLA